MSRRTSMEAKFVTWAEQAPLASVAIVLGIVKEKVRMRQLVDVGVQTVPAKRKVARKRKPDAGARPSLEPAMFAGEAQ
jgi:hypothetical protein